MTREIICACAESECAFCACSKAQFRWTRPTWRGPFISERDRGCSQKHRAEWIVCETEFEKDYQNQLITIKGGGKIPVENICRYYLAVNEKRSYVQTTYGSFAFHAFLVQHRQIMLTAPYADIKGPKSACTTKHDEDERLPCPLIKSVDTLGCLNREQKSG